MKSRMTPAERRRRAHVRLRVLRHFDEVTRNVSQTCRHFVISRSQFYFWRERYQDQGEPGLVERKRGPRISPFRTPPEIEALVLKVRQERQYGSLRICLFMRRYCDVYVSPPTIARILRENRMPRVSQKQYRPGPSRRRELRIPGQSVQVDVKHVKVSSGRLSQFTAIDKATRYRVPKIYDHNSIRSAIDFIDELRQRLPVAIQTIRTDNGSAFGTDFTWHLNDLGIKHKHIPPGCPETNGKVERSHGTDEDEFYRRFTFGSPTELRSLLRDWEREYNHRRPHLALKGRTPAEALCELRIKPNLLCRFRL